VQRTVGKPIWKIQIEILAIGREHERAITDFEAVETDRVGLIKANDLAQVRPVQTVVGGLGQAESCVKRVIGKFGVIDD